MADDQAQGVDKGLFITGVPPSFSNNGKHIIIRLQPSVDIRRARLGEAQVNVWSYRDSVLQSVQLLEKSDAVYKAAITVGSNKVIRLEQGDESAMLPVEGDFILVHNHSSIHDYWWPSYSERTAWMVSLIDGSRKRLPTWDMDYFTFSPRGRYFVYGDTRDHQYYSYELQTGRILNISKNIHISLAATDRYEVDKGHLPGTYLRQAGIAAWLDDGSAILVYDCNYDIWQLDLAGKKMPENITNSYALNRHIKFRVLGDDALVKGVPANADLLLVAFNTDNKYNGFYRKRLGVKGYPKELTMGPYTYEHPSFNLRGETPINCGLRPLKARDTDTWMVSRQSAVEAPNYYITKDFKTYKALTSLAPHKAYNWYTTELINWKQLDGTPSKGILYKPENFDPHKKYPVIFYYYERLSFMVYDWLEPDFTGSSMNIPWFVSHGYLVFCPDIYYTAGHPGKGVVNSVVSAAQYLSKLPFVDKKRMGLQGHSFGGFETNYLVTHTHLFAGASVGAGLSDFVGDYDALRGPPGKENIAAMAAYESSQLRIGATLWQRPDLYIENSPLFRADQVTTPLLIMHNKADPASSWRHGIEFYMGLRRLQKKVWMLEYDNGTHGVDGKDAVDYTIRMTQFFDHYLKGAPAPVWMTQGIPAKLKGIDDGLALDPNGKP